MKFSRNNSNKGSSSMVVLGEEKQRVENLIDKSVVECDKEDYWYTDDSDDDDDDDEDGYDSEYCNSDNEDSDDDDDDDDNDDDNDDDKEDDTKFEDEKNGRENCKDPKRNVADIKGKSVVD